MSEEDTCPDEIWDILLDSSYDYSIFHSHYINKHFKLVYANVKKNKTILREVLQKVDTILHKWDCAIKFLTITALRIDLIPEQVSSIILQYNMSKHCAHVIKALRDDEIVIQLPGELSLLYSILKGVLSEIIELFCPYSNNDPENSTNINLAKNTASKLDAVNVPERKKTEKKTKHNNEVFSLLLDSQKTKINNQMEEDSNDLTNNCYNSRKTESSVGENNFFNLKTKNFHTENFSDSNTDDNSAIIYKSNEDLTVCDFVKDNDDKLLKSIKITVEDEKQTSINNYISNNDNTESEIKEIFKKLPFFKENSDQNLTKITENIDTKALLKGFSFSSTLNNPIEENYNPPNKFIKLEEKSN